MTTLQVHSNWIVKRIVSGDTIEVRQQPKGGPPPEKTITLSNINAPKLGRRIPKGEQTKDEPYAFEAREFLRKKLIGQEVSFVEERTINNKIFGNVWLGNDTNEPSVVEQLVSEGLVTVKRDTRNITPELARLQELEDAAKNSNKGKWSSSSSSEHVRDVKYVEDNLQSVMDKYGKKPVKAIIEYVHDGSTVKALLLPDFYHITLAIAGIRCPRKGSVDQTNLESFYAEEAHFFTESRLLQRDVEITLESVSNSQFVGSIIHPKGNIAEALLNQGFARVVEWSMKNLKPGAQRIYFNAEKAAKEERLRRWKDFVPAAPSVEYNAVVYEITGADSMVVKSNSGEMKKIFLSSIRPPPRKNVNTDVKGPTKSRALYDTPFMFEAREFLRKKLIRKPVKVIVDYIQPAKDGFLEKTCCTVLVGKVNIAEALVSKGLGTVVRYRQNDDQRSSFYNELREAEEKAEKLQSGLHGLKKDVPIQKVRDVSTEAAMAKSHLQALKRAREVKAVVEFVNSGSRLKLYIPKEHCLITFLLSGVKVPRAPRYSPGTTTGSNEGEPFGEEAMLFTKDLCYQKEVDIIVENMESKGSGFIGWLFVDNINLSVALVEEGLASVSTFLEQGEYYKALKEAEERAKSKRLKIWADYVEVEVEAEKVEEEKQPIERKIDPQEVVISEVTKELHFFAQKFDQRNNLESLQSRLRQELATNPPLPGAYTPKRGDMCVAKFTDDDQWYRVKIEKVTGGSAHVFYIDYGNREVIESSRLGSLPAGFSTDKPYANEYVLACIELPKDEEDQDAAVYTVRADTLNGDKFLLNIESKFSAVPLATLVHAERKEDIGKELIRYGYALANMKERRLKSLIAEYREAEELAKKEHVNIWQYGDIREDPQKDR